LKTLKSKKKYYTVYYPVSLRVSVGVLYELENCEVELYHVLQIWVGKIYNCFQSHISVQSVAQKMSIISQSYIIDNV